MDRNGFFASNPSQSRPRWNINSSNSWTRTRYLSTAKSYQSSFPGTLVRGRPTHLNDPIARTINKGASSSLQNSKLLSVANSSTFSRAAGVSTVDQNMRYSKLPWLGNSFLSRSFWGKKEAKHSSKRTLNIKTPRTDVRSGTGYDTVSGKSRTEVNIAESRVDSINSSQQGNYTDDRNKILEKQSSKKKVVLLTDHALKRMRETSNIYLEKNSAFYKQRIRNIETNIGNKHRAQIDRQMTEVETVRKEKHEKSVQNMAELSNVRNKFWKEKKKRVRTTYVSVAALELPEVDRYAYGLPADGKEYTIITKKPAKSKSNAAERWKASMCTAKSIVKVLALRDKVERTKTLPILKPLTSHSKRRKGVNKIEDFDDTELNDTYNDELANLEDDGEANNVDATETKLSAAKALLELTSDLSSLQDTTTDIDTDFEDF